MPAALTISLVAGEASGDNLGAPLLRAIRAERPDARFVGIGGDAMIREGLECWTSIDRLSVMGFVDPIKRLPDLLRILLSTRDRILEAEVDCFVGVDFNFFNLLLEGMLRRRGVSTVHYVSPTVWAWRKGRIRRIRRSVDLMLTLFPFETDIYEANGIAVRFVGHPKADEIDPDQDADATLSARRALGFDASDCVVALLPGSRGAEVRYTGPDFLAAAALISRERSVRFVVPAANEKRKVQIDQLVGGMDGELDIRVIDGNSRLAMQAADAVMVNSGTATLEAMLLKKPMVMSYRLGAMSYAIVSRLVSTPYFALPNILAGQRLVPEFIQDDARPDAIATALLELLGTSDHGTLLEEFDRIHRSLRRDAGRQAARAVLDLCGGRA